MAIPLSPPSPLIKLTVAASSIEMQSHKTFPSPVQTTSARWPMANCGCVPMPITPGSCWRYALKYPAASAASVVQVCPRGGTYCRSSSQMTHCRGAASLGAYWVPQAVQMNASISPVRNMRALCGLIIDRSRRPNTSDEANGENNEAVHERCTCSPQDRRSAHLSGRTRRIAPSREGPHERRRRHCGRAPAAPHGRGAWCHAAHRRTRGSDTIGRVRGTPNAHRLLLHVAHRPPRPRAVRGMQLLYFASARAFVPAFPRRHLRHVLPRAIRGERPLPRLHGLGDAVVLGQGLARHAPGRTPRGHDAHRLLLATGNQSFRDLLDDAARRRGDGQQLPAARPDRLRTAGDV